MHLHNIRIHMWSTNASTTYWTYDTLNKKGCVLVHGMCFAFCMPIHQYCLCLISIFTLLACLHFLSNHFNCSGCLFASQATQIDDFFSINHSSSSQNLFIYCSNFITHIFKMSTHNAIWIWCFVVVVYSCLEIWLRPGVFFLYYYELLIFMIYLSVKELNLRSFAI